MLAEDFLSIGYSPQLVRSAVGYDGIHKWISAPNYTPHLEDEYIVLSGFDFEKFLTAWAFDTRRLLSAARETAKSISETKSSANSTAWLLIKSYYAAFYYAHVTLRLSRISLTYTTTLHLINLRRLLDAFSIEPPYSLKTNQYTFEFSEKKKEVRIRQKSGSDGTHENTWHTFLDLIAGLQTLALRGATDDLQLIGINRLHDLIKQAVTVSESGKYLSSVRNEVQYQQLHGVWPPYGSSLQADYCARRLKETTKQTTSIEALDIDSVDKATQFLNSCLLICWSAEKLINHVVKRERSSFMASVMR